MNKYAIEAKNIIKNYIVGNVVSHVLCNVSIGIVPGEFAYIVGSSGSGKSTLLYVLSGLDSPTSGSVLMNGRDISQFNDTQKSIMRRKDIGFIFQFYNLVPNLNVTENILLPVLLDAKKVDDHYKKQLKELLEIVGLTDKRYHTPRELSGGQQQRVAIARALINEPAIIFADEPTGNLDSKTSTEILSILQEINTEKNKTILMVTHSKQAAQYGNRLISVCDGIVG